MLVSQNDLKEVLIHVFAKHVLCHTRTTKAQNSMQFYYAHCLCCSLQKSILQLVLIAEITCLVVYRVFMNYQDDISNDNVFSYSFRQHRQLGIRRNGTVKLKNRIRIVR